MKRRSFLGRATALAMASYIPTKTFSAAREHKYKMGLQLFSVHQDMTNDPVATLKAVKQMGYQDFEIFGFDDQKVTYYGYAAADFRSILDDLQLTASSGHYGFSPLFSRPDDEMRRFVDQCIKGAKSLGTKYVTWPWLAPELRTNENFKILSGKLNAIGKQVTEAGLGFAYHNHGFEFEEYDGQTGYEIIVSETDPSLVKLQMDLYWVMHSSRKTPKQLIREQPGRYVMWHIKDMDKVTRDYTELGNGSINYVEVLPDPVASGLQYYYLEQGGNFAQSPMKSASDSATYFKQHLQKYL